MAGEATQGELQGELPSQLTWTEFADKMLSCTFTIAIYYYYYLADNIQCILILQSYGGWKAET